MPVPFPPPDPRESLGMEPSDAPPPTAAVVHVAGAPTPRGARISDAILQARPGVLIVVSRE